MNLFLNFSEQLLRLSKLHCFIVKILTRYELALKHAAAMALHQAYLMAYIYSHIKFYWPKVRGS